MTTQSSIQVGLLQYSLGNDRLQNLVTALSEVKSIAKYKPDMIVLPEMWLGGPEDPATKTDWIQFYQKAFNELKFLCLKHKMGFCLSQLEQSKNNIFNTAYFVGQNGKLLGKYRKIHLFSYGGEKKIFSKPPPVVSTFLTPFGRAGMVICYDIRFPELIRKMAILGAKVVFVMAQWPKVRTHHWLTLLMARAIENQIFIVACNRLGKKNGEVFAGDSVVINPWGQTLLHLNQKQTAGIIDIDLNCVEDIRKQYPFFKERRIL